MHIAQRQEALRQTARPLDEGIHAAGVVVQFELDMYLALIGRRSKQDWAGHAGMDLTQPELAVDALAHPQKKRNQRGTRAEPTLDGRLQLQMEAEETPVILVVPVIGTIDYDSEMIGQRPYVQSTDHHPL